MSKKSIILDGVLLLLAVPAFLALADVEDREQREVGGVLCTAISHLNEPQWTTKYWYMRGWGGSEAEWAIDQIGLSSTLSVNGQDVGTGEDFRTHDDLAETAIHGYWWGSWWEVCYTSDHRFGHQPPGWDHADKWYPQTTPCYSSKAGGQPQLLKRMRGAGPLPGRSFAAGQWEVHYACTREKPC